MELIEPNLSLLDTTPVAYGLQRYVDRQKYLKMEIQTARDISGLDKPNIIVYGGGEKIREICLQNNVLYVEQFLTRI